MYLGSPIDDSELLEALPGELRNLLVRANGYVAYHGGLHVRGACRSPGWHSLRSAWRGEEAFHRLYREVEPGDVPFAEDALGDQYLLRDGIVHRLSAESGDVESLGVDLVEFDLSVRADPVGYLALSPLEAFRAEGGTLNPGELLHVFPPFIAQESGVDVTYRPIPALEQRRWLAGLARQVRELPDGAQIRIAPLS